MSEEDCQRAMNGELRYTEVRPAAYNAKARLEDMRADDIDMSVLYPTQLLGIQSNPDVGYANAQCRAYNDWLSDHVSEGEGKLFGAALLPRQDIELATAELRRAAELPGIVAAFIRPNPTADWKPFNHSVYDPIWQAASDTGMPLGLHPFLDSRLPGACIGMHFHQVHEHAPSFIRGTEERRRHRHRQHLLQPGIVEPVRHDELDGLPARGWRVRALPRVAPHLPGGERRLDRAVARTARPPHATCRCSSPTCPTSDGAVGVLPPPVLDQLRRRRVDARVAPRTRRSSAPTASSGPPTTRTPTRSYPVTTDELYEAIEDLSDEQQRLIASDNTVSILRPFLEGLCCVESELAVQDRAAVRVRVQMTWASSVNAGRDARPVGAGFDPEFVVPAAQVLHERVAVHDHAGGAVALEATHRSQPRLEPTMVCLDPIVRVLLGVVERAREELIDDGEERPGPIGHHLRRLAVSDRARSRRTVARPAVSRRGET